MLLLLLFRGVQAAYYLMFSDNLMVRRAATETLCNMASHPSVIKVCVHY